MQSESQGKGLVYLLKIILPFTPFNLSIPVFFSYTFSSPSFSTAFLHGFVKHYKEAVILTDLTKI